MTIFTVHCTYFYNKDLKFKQNKNVLLIISKYAAYYLSKKRMRKSCMNLMIVKEENKGRKW